MGRPAEAIDALTNRLHDLRAAVPAKDGAPMRRLAEGERQVFDVLPYSPLYQNSKRRIPLKWTLPWDRWH